MKRQFLNLAVTALLFTGPIFARHARCSSCVRDSRGHIARSMTARRAFARSHPCPSTGSGRGACPGYIVDHRRALKHGGTDTPDNMNWQTVKDAKVKDQIE